MERGVVVKYAKQVSSQAWARDSLLPTSETSRVFGSAIVETVDQE